MNGRKGIWGHAVGGMGSITLAMAHEAERLGVGIRCEVEVQRIPRNLYLGLIDASDLDEDSRARIQHWHCTSGSFCINVALAELPRFECLPEPRPQLSTGSKRSFTIVRGSFQLQLPRSKPCNRNGTPVPARPAWAARIVPICLKRK